MTIPTRLVLEALLMDPDTEQYGAGLADAAGLPTGTLHPILARLERSGWVSSRWEDTDPAAAGRPRRRYYRLTPDGEGLATDAVARSRQRARGTLRPAVQR